MNVLFDVTAAARNVQVGSTLHAVASAICMVKGVAPESWDHDAQMEQWRSQVVLTALEARLAQELINASR